jgi:hypothetical protein
MDDIAENQSDEASLAKASEPSPLGTIRHNRFCIFWAFFLAISLVIGVLLASPSKGRAIALAIAAYAGQGLIAEILGLRVGPEGIVAPRRWTLLGPLLLWRRRVRIEDTISIVAKPKSIWGEQVVLYHVGGAKQALFFPTRKQKLAFFKAVTDSNKMVSIFRAE